MSGVVTRPDLLRRYIGICAEAGMTEQEAAATLGMTNLHFAAVCQAVRAEFRQARHRALSVTLRLMEADLWPETTNPDHSALAFAREAA